MRLALVLPHQRMISEDTKALLRDHIESFEQLEILLLLHRMGGDTWTPSSVADELNLRSDIAAEALDHLCRGHLLAVRVEGSARLFGYSPGNPGMEAAVANLAQVYAENRLEVMNLMNTNAIERVRTSAMRAFANSFLLGGGGKKNDG